MVLIKQLKGAQRCVYVIHHLGESDLMKLGGGHGSIYSRMIIPYIPLKIDKAIEHYRSGLDFSILLGYIYNVHKSEKTCAEEKQMVNGIFCKKVVET